MCDSYPGFCSKLYGSIYVHFVVADPDPEPHTYRTLFRQPFNNSLYTYLQVSTFSQEHKTLKDSLTHRPQSPRAADWRQKSTYYSYSSPTPTCDT